MRSPDDRIPRRPRLALALIAVPALAGCGVLGGSHRDLASAPATPAALAAANGPAADYPVVVGDPYRVGATLFTPADTMNYDEVGYAAVDGGVGVTGSHHTLPLPSYVEVTSLETGKTVLVRIERRGPMDGDAVVALSPTAFAQLGAAAGDPVRVRRVNPPEEERAALRNGRAAPARMDTPASLVAVLKRKLPGEGSAPLTPKAPAPAALASVELPASSAPQRALSQPVASAAPAPAAVNRVATRGAPPPLPPLPVRNHEASAGTPPAFTLGTRQDVRQSASAPTVAVAVEKSASTDGAFIVQAAAMSTAERAKRVAGTIGGSVSKSGDYFRVRTGPFATRAEAEASLAKVRAAGYSDARIFTNG
jgi:rare lipoprotein A